MASLHRTGQKALPALGYFIDCSPVDFYASNALFVMIAVFAHSICLFCTAAFIEKVLFMNIPLAVLTFVCHAWPWLCCPWCSFLFLMNDSREWPASPLCATCGQRRRCRATSSSLSLFANFVLHFSLAEASMSHHGQECTCTSDSTDVHCFNHAVLFFF